MPHTLIEILISFILFMLMQSIFINGVFEAFKGSCVEDIDRGRVCSGNILYKINPEWFERNKYKYWAKNIFTCVKCMASSYGAVTYWPLVIYLFGFHWEEIPVYVFDVFCLTVLNWFFYKRL